jgi:hypothetical protein
MKQANSTYSRFCRAFGFFLFFASLFGPCCFAAPTLDQHAIHEDYNNGDFDKVLADIEKVTAGSPSFSRSDSIFIAKHLAVVYTANPQTREKGKHYMHRLLELMPSADLVDMFVGDEVDRIFEKVRKEYMLRQVGFGVDTTKVSLPERPGAVKSVAPKPPRSASRATSASASQPFWMRRNVWIIGGAGIAVVGAVTAYVLASDEPKVESISVPSTSN